MSEIVSEWLHRKGITRVVYVGSDNYSGKGVAMVDTKAPRWLARRLARRQLTHSQSLIGRFDLDTVRIVKVHNLGDGKTRWVFGCERMA